MKRVFVSMIMALALGATALAQKPHEAQDPTKTLPKSYQVEFENHRVRIVRVHYDAKGKLPEHAHPGGITIYL